ncbi:MAG: FapA family protein [Rhodocyclaceae bacterium]|nr:FapA family protein [Rhodocyclaceae bacterium]
MTEPSAIGNVAELKEGQLLLPGFISRRSDGLYIDLLAIDSRALVLQFVERVFAAGARFVDLDYELFLDLLFNWQPADIDRQLQEFKRKGKPPQVRLAQDIVPFPDERRGIYRGVKILDGGKAAEYLFEQISVEREVDDPEAPDGSGRRTVSERLYADFDEFIAALWDKNLRYGIDARAVREAIARDKAERLAIASMKPPTQGKDASVDEQTDLLHRDDAPRLLPNGRMDLHHYRNRFPQVTAGTRLFKKVPRLDGISGWDVQGKELEPAAIKDFDIQTLAGPGTTVIKDGAGECVVAVADGFLNIDAQSGQISVIDKIVSREGVSMRTTGDLSLAGDEYEEHGEVQENRSIEGHNMTFLADVFGNIVSDGGVVTLKRNISGGSIQNAGGEVFVEAGASRSTLESRGGTVTANHAETCLIIADKVRLGRAIRCEIVADDVEIESSEGCAIAAKKVVLKNSGMRKDEATNLTMLLPDLTHYDREAGRLRETRAEIEAEIEKCGIEFQELAGLPDMKTYLAIQPRVKSKELVMSAAQQTQWQALLTRLAPTLRRFAALNGELQAARQELTDTDAEIVALGQERMAAARGIACTIAAVTGDTQVHTLRPSFEDKPLAQLPPKELHKRLREAGDVSSRLFSGSSGSFEWQAPEEAADPSGPAPA